VAVPVRISCTVLYNVTRCNAIFVLVKKIAARSETAQHGSAGYLAVLTPIFVLYCIMLLSGAHKVGYGMFHSRDNRATQCPAVDLGHPVSGGHKYGDLVLQVGCWAWG
jgi:hypothetical protein